MKNRVLAVVTYGLPDNTDRATAVQMFRDSIPRYRATAGLLRKNVIWRDGLGGGIYLWESRAAADAAYSDEWKAYMTGKYHHPPRIDFYECPVTIDNEHDAVADEQVDTGSANMTIAAD